MKRVHEYRATSLIGCFSTCQSFKYLKADREQGTMLEKAAKEFMRKYAGHGLEPISERAGYILDHEYNGSTRLYYLVVD